jgi:hypothetical protein
LDLPIAPKPISIAYSLSTIDANLLIKQEWSSIEKGDSEHLKTRSFCFSTSFTFRQ